MYTFSPASLDDLPAVFALIDRRVLWMQQRNNHLWDAYRDVYPDNYFRDLVREGRLYLLKTDGEVAAMISLWDSDEKWTDGAPALYLHNLAADERFPGAGAESLRRCAMEARALGRDRLRLDCTAHNPRLNDYYAAQGFAYVSTCPGDIYYTPNLRERVL